MSDWKEIEVIEKSSGNRIKIKDYRFNPDIHQKLDEVDGDQPGPKAPKTPKAPKAPKTKNDDASDGGSEGASE